MLAGISWGTYIITVLVLLGLWYGYLISRFYRDKLKALLKGSYRNLPLTESLQNEVSPFAEFEEPFDTLQDAEELHKKILSVFSESFDRGISRIEFLNYIQFVISEYPYVKQSALRARISSLMVLESRKYPDLQLTAEQADRLWEFKE